MYFTRHISEVVNNDKFRANIKKRVNGAKSKVALTVSKFVFELQKGFIVKSPVDTGRFKGNWMIGIGAINFSNSNGESKTALNAYDDYNKAILSILKIDGTKPVYITNSLPYSRRIEYGLFGNPEGSANGAKTTGGYSTQAPAGCVRVTIAEMNSYMKQSIISVRAINIR